MSFLRTPITLLLGSSIVCLGGRAAAQGTSEVGTRPKEPAVPTVESNTPAGMFGYKGELAISSDAGLSISNTSRSGDHGSVFSIILLPAIDYFVIDNLSVGGYIGLNYTSVPGGHSTQFAVGPRVGYDFPISRIFSIWPKLGLSFSTTSTSGTATAESDTSSHLALNLFVPFMVHPAPHFFLGFGPALDVDLTGNVKSTTVAGRLTIGGWI